MGGLCSGRRLAHPFDGADRREVAEMLFGALDDDNSKWLDPSELIGQVRASAARHSGGTEDLTAPTFSRDSS